MSFDWVTAVRGVALLVWVGVTDAALDSLDDATFEGCDPVFCRSSDIRLEWSNETI